MDLDNLRGYRKLVVWQKADNLALNIYIVTKNFPKEEIFGLTSQMRRAAFSVPANIVEGYARAYPKEKRQFYNIASASLAELEYYIDFTFRLQYFSKNEYDQLTSLRSEIGRLLNGFVKYTRNEQ